MKAFLKIGRNKVVILLFFLQTYIPNYLDTNLLLKNLIQLIS